MWGGCTGENGGWVVRAGGVVVMKGVRGCGEGLKDGGDF